MVVLDVFSKSIKVKYKSTLLSKATVLAILSGLFRIILPFIIAYKTGGFWLKREIYYEQPKVNMLGDYLLIAVTNDASNPIICSTYAFYKNYLKDLDFCSSIKLREVDKNFDAKNDELELEMNVNLHTYKIHSINLVLPIKYELSDLCPLTMQSLIVYQHYFQQEKVTELQVFAHLHLFQSSAIVCRRKFAQVYNMPIIENGHESKNFAIENVVAKYLNRNVTTHLTNVHTFVKTENKKTFDLKLNIKYPEHKIYYQPDFWHILKSAWIQYFAVYVIVEWLARKLNNYIFYHRLVWYYEEYPLKIK